MKSYICFKLDSILVALQGVGKKLDRLLAGQGFQTQLEIANMATLDEVLVDVTDERTQIEGLSTLTAGIKQQLADALAGTTLPPQVQAKVDAVFAGIESNKAAVVKAINDNTPAASVPTGPAP